MKRLLMIVLFPAVVCFVWLVTGEFRKALRIALDEVRA